MLLLLSASGVQIWYPTACIDQLLIFGKSLEDVRLAQTQPNFAMIVIVADNEVLDLQ
jgi:hypothetical protein